MKSARRRIEGLGATSAKTIRPETHNREGSGTQEAQDISTLPLAAQILLIKIIL